MTSSIIIILGLLSLEVSALFNIQQLLSFLPDFGRVSPVLQLHKSLCEIPSITQHEHEVGLFLADYLKKNNYTVERLPIEPGSSRENIFAYLGSNRSSRVMVTSHIE